MKPASFAMTTAVLFSAWSATAQQVTSECRREIFQLCGAPSGERSKLRQCVLERVSALSDKCRTEVASRAGGNSPPAAGRRELSFGSDPKQRLDFVAAQGASGPSPIVVFVHGGGWAIGDKGSAAGAKAAHFSALGYGFASLNYRLVPQATVEQQAADVASGLAYLRSNAAKLDIDPDRIILSGHSSGAHVAALVSSDPAYLKAASVPMTAIKGVVLLDGAGYDVARQMANPRNRVEEIYGQAFGKDPIRQAALSPITHAAMPNAAEWLILPVASRADSTSQSQSFAAALRNGGAKVVVTPVPDSSHAQLNKNLGMAGDFATAQVDAFIRRVLERR